MKANQNKLKADSTAFEQGKEKPLTKDCFMIKPLDNKCTLKLKGNFNGNNTSCISTALRKSTSFHKKCMELDMSTVEIIDMKAMALLIISLKTLKENGTHTQVTGLNGDNLKLANELGMHFIAQII